jgi:hypothetical protein
MEKYKKTKTTQEDSQSATASNHTMRKGDFKWVSSHNNHIYFNEEWNGEYES